MTLAEALGTSQAAVHRFESPNKGRPTISTLKKIAAVFDVGLEVRFVPFSKLAKFVSGTPYLESGLATDSFYVAPFAEDTGIRAPSAPAPQMGVAENPAGNDAGSAKKPSGKTFFDAAASSGFGGL